MKTSKFLSAIGAAVGLALASGPVAAQITFFSPITAFQDDDIEFVFDLDQSGTVSVGDRILAVGEIANTQGIFAGQGPAPIGPGSELTFVSDVTIVGINAATGDFIMAPTVGGVLAGIDPNATIAAWTDATPDLNVIGGSCGTQAQCLSAAGLGGADGSVLFAAIGFGDLDDVWTGEQATGTLAQIQAGGSSTKFAEFNFSQSVLINNTGLTLGQQACAPFCSGLGDGLVDVTGSGDFLGGQGLTAANWTARSDADLQIVLVPEPGSLALVGLALAGMGALRRRREFVK